MAVVLRFSKTIGALSRSIATASDMAAYVLALMRERNKKRKGCKEEDNVAEEIK
jgi:hypothetical protein